MFNFLKNLFKTAPEYSLGALKNNEDVRDIQITQVQAPVAIPTEYKTDITMLEVEDQMDHGTCVAQVLSKLREYYWFKRDRSIPKISARSLYILSKRVDGIPEMQGTFPRVSSGILINQGIATDTFVPDDNYLPYGNYMNFEITESIKVNMSTQKLFGYAFVPNDFNAVRQAIYQNGVVAGSLPVDSDWAVGLLRRLGSHIGWHYTLWYGYDNEGVFGRNSWGTRWVATFIGKIIPAGDFYFLWEDYKNVATDIIAFVDIPKEILEEVKAKNFYFLNTMKLRERSSNVLELQKRLEKEGLWTSQIPKTGFYGNYTAEGVLKYQKLHKVASEAELNELRGRACGNKTLNVLNAGTTTSKIDLWCLATQEHEGWFKSSRSFRNNNPGNIKFVGQKSAKGQDSGGFCIFPTYEIGYKELKDMFIRACSGNSRSYRSDMTLLEFYEVYAPASDNNVPTTYARYVAKRIGVDITTKIKTLL